MTVTYYIVANNRPDVPVTSLAIAQSINIFQSFSSGISEGKRDRIALPHMPKTTESEGEREFAANIGEAADRITRPEIKRPTIH